MRPPAETIAWVQPHFANFGITRVSNVTGLDVIGIPVVMVARPNSRGLAVSQGKGLSLDHAKASGIMESIEGWHSEHIRLPLWRASATEIERSHRVIRHAGLPRSYGGTLDPGLQLLWVEGTDLVSGDSIWVPEEVVGVDCSLPMPPSAGCFSMTSNGLASGNHPLEAISHGLCEVIERDSKTLFDLVPKELGATRRIDLESVTDADCRDLLERCSEAGVFVAMWDITSDIGLPTLTCEIFDRVANPWRPLPISSGHGCHLNPKVAFIRALTEAAQSRLTYIAGARDDNLYTEYAEAESAESVAQRRRLMKETPTRAFSELPDLSTDSLEEDVAAIVRLLMARGMDEIVTIDLSHQEFGIPVFRVVVPGLEHRGPGGSWYQPNQRAQKFVAQLHEVNSL